MYSCMYALGINWHVHEFGIFGRFDWFGRYEYCGHGSTEIFVCLPESVEIEDQFYSKESDFPSRDIRSVNPIYSVPTCIVATVVELNLGLLFCRSLHTHWHCLDFDTESLQGRAGQPEQAEFHTHKHTPEWLDSLGCSVGVSVSILGMTVTQGVSGLDGRGCISGAWVPCTCPCSCPCICTCPCHWWIIVNRCSAHLGMTTRISPSCADWWQC